MQNPAWCALVCMCRFKHTGTHGEGQKEMREQEESLIRAQHIVRSKSRSSHSVQNPAWCALVCMCRFKHTGIHGEGQKEMREQEESLMRAQHIVRSKSRSSHTVQNPS